MESIHGCSQNGLINVELAIFNAVINKVSLRWSKYVGTLVGEYNKLYFASSEQAFWIMSTTKLGGDTMEKVTIEIFGLNQPMPSGG